MTKKEQRDQIRAQLAKAQLAGKRSDLLLKGIVVLISILVLASLGWLVWNSKTNSGASVKQLGEETCFKDACPHEHIAQGSPRPNYVTNPPNSGNHWPTPAECKIYDKEVQDEAAIHSLEHGAVWISYQDKNDKALKKELEDVVNEMDKSKLLLAPRSANDSKIALTSWGRILKLDEFDKEKIEDYIKLYRNGPSAREPLAGCSASMPL